jgi:serine/threonine-protein kinase
MVRLARDVVLERWDEVDALFQEALDRSPGARREFLTSACSGDQELFDTVSRLLESLQSESDRLSGPGETLLRHAFTRPESEDSSESVHAGAPGDTLGPYRLVREIGRGGMATVFEAERADGAFQRTVAVKILRGLEKGELARRFQAERQILSSLEHPNIARLLDGGTSPDGRPFLVMEFVKGEPITIWADRRKLTIPERIRVFLKVAGAVHYAHVRLVVHRDIKPTNVLAGDGETGVKLLDFGIAKLLDDGGDRPAETLGFTQWMTPRYASPEQIQGRPVTTATDVHGLGVLLYELLTGSRPFGGAGESEFELARIISQQVPRLPSAAVAAAGGDGSEETESGSAAQARSTTPERLRRELVGDLDAIVAKALRKDPVDRYPSVQAMVDDLARYQAGFPVRAREGMAAYRARKFLARHWLGVTVAGVVAVTLLGASATLALQQREIRRERDRANQSAMLATQEAENAQTIVDFLADVFRGRDPSQAPSDTITARELLAWGTEKVESEFAERPEVQGELYAVLGGAHSNLGLLDEGRALLERAVAAMEDIHGERSEEVAGALVRLAGVHRTSRDFPLAVPHLERALDIRRELFGPDDERIGEVLVSLGGTMRDVGQPDSAEVLLRKAMRIGGAYSGDGELATRAALGLAYVLRGQDKLDEAEALYESFIPSAREVAGIPAGDLAMHLNNLAYLRRVRGDYDGAQKLYAEALEISERLYGLGHPNSLQFARNLANALFFLGQSNEAVDLLRESVLAAEAQWPAGHWRVGSEHKALGLALLRSGQPEAAKDPIREAARIFTEQLGENHNWTYFAGATYRVAQILTDEPEEGREELDSFLEVLTGTYQREGNTLPPDLRMLTEPLINVLRETGLNEYADGFQALMPNEG